MQDHPAFADVPGRIQIILAEVKGGNRACSLNASWIAPERDTLHRVLYAVGAFPREKVPDIAAQLCRNRFFDDGNAVVQFFAIGVRKSHDAIVASPVVQLTWDEILAFVFNRLREYPQVKSHHPQWDRTGTNLYRDAVIRCGGDCRRFVEEWKEKMGVSPTPALSSMPT